MKRLINQRIRDLDLIETKSAWFKATKKLAYLCSNKKTLFLLRTPTFRCVSISFADHLGFLGMAITSYLYFKDYNRVYS